MTPLKLFAVSAGAVIALALPFSAFAATISDARFSNSQTDISGTGGSTVSGTFTLTVGNNEVVEWLRLIPNGNPFTEASVGGNLGYQEGVYTNVPFSVKLPPNTGTYNVDGQGAGIFGGIRAINGGDNVVVGPTSLGTVRVVVSGGSTSSTDTTAPMGIPQAIWDKFLAWMSGSTGSTTPAPIKPACPPLFNGANASMVQDWLLTNGYAASFNAISVYHSTGHWGNASISAYTSASAACK